MDLDCCLQPVEVDVLRRQCRRILPTHGSRFLSQVRNDAEQRFPIANLKIADPKACQCGEVLKGVIKPSQCKVFGTACTPQAPLGSLMVSSEGACAAYYQFGDVEKVHQTRAEAV